MDRYVSGEVNGTCGRSILQVLSTSDGKYKCSLQLIVRVFAAVSSLQRVIFIEEHNLSCTIKMSIKLVKQKARECLNYSPPVIYIDLLCIMEIIKKNPQIATRTKPLITRLCDMCSKNCCRLHAKCDP